MAEKKSTPVKKAPAKAATKPAAPKAAKPTPARPTARPPAARSPAARNPAARKPPTRSTQGIPGRAGLGGRVQRPVRTSWSLDKKLDFLGTAMSITGVLTLLSFLWPIRSSGVGLWVQTLAQLFGWGMYAFPFGLIVIGLWLVLRNFERIPPLAIERLVGFLLLFVSGLGILHVVEMWLSQQGALVVAQAGGGGGYVGALAVGGLNAVLGIAGTVIVLAALLVISLALSFDVTILEMGGWIRSCSESLQNRFQDWLDERRFGAPEPDDSQPGWETLPYPPGHTSGSAGALPAPNQPLIPAGRSNPPSIVAGAPQAVAPARPGAPPAPVWKLPPMEQILDEGGEVNYSDEIDLERAHIIEVTLTSFGAPSRVVEINRGPTITQFGVEPDFIETRNGRMRVRVSKITALADDLALALSARTIRVQAPVPGKGFVGIEVPNEQVALVALRDIMESEAIRRLKSPLRFALGLNVSGNAVAADLASMPHLLIAGATGSGKSVCVNALISCLLLNNTPDDLRLVMVDPKRVELTGYNGIPHLLAPVVVDLEKVVTVLQWVTREMDMRYRKLAEVGARNISEFNQKQAGRGEAKLPYLVVIIDELADLMMLAPEETEKTITRLAQLARATGIHLVIATQRPSVDVVTGLIKANFPARVAFAVASGVDSRVILDQPGAERLLGRGDMLFQAPDAPAPARLQGVFVADSEIQRLVGYWQAQAGRAQPAATAAGGIVDAPAPNLPLKQMPLWDEMEKEEDGDPMLQEAIDLSRRQGRASVSMLQRRLRIGYTRASRLVETMEEKGIVGPPEPGTGTRPILDYGPAAPPVDET